jgi:hypothetical protein
MKNGSTSLAIKEMRIKTALRFYLAPFRMAIIKRTTNVGEDGVQVGSHKEERNYVICRKIDGTGSHHVN